jgi:uncharacterized protein
MKSITSYIFAFIILVFSACSQTEKTKTNKNHPLPKRIGSVNDFENIFSDQEEKTLDSLIKDFEKQTSIEIAVVTLDTTMTTLETFNSYTLRLLRDWNIGKKKKNDGILIGISSSLQRVRISNGLGVEKSLSDIETKRVLDDFMFPEFRKGNFFEGTKKGINELVTTLE